MIARPTTRYSCPLECGWFHDVPEPSLEADTQGVYAQAPGETFQDVIGRVASDTARNHARNVETVVAEHLTTHTLFQALTKVAQQRQELNQLRSTVAQVREYAESRCTEENANIASAAWVLHLIEGDQTVNPDDGK
jgi:hypothetical protein